MDRATQRWVIRTGRRISFSEQPWLDGPVGSPHRIGEQWIGEHAAAIGATVSVELEGGLLPDLAVLNSETFSADTLHADVRSFYEHTARWQLDVWSRWRRWAEPGGRLLNAVFARRLRQLSLPLDPLEVAHGMDSRVLSLRSSDGVHVGTAWQRSLRATDATVFGGFYGVVTPPAGKRPSIRVVFPLPNGSVTVLLRPQATPGGGLRLVSPAGDFGTEGAYLIVRPDRATIGWVRRVPLPEQFDVYVDAHGDMRCDHRLCLGPAELLHLHYRMRRS